MIFFGSFYLVNLILAIVSRSYLEQQNTVEAENQECQRRKTEEARQELEARAILDVENALDFQDEYHLDSHSDVSIQYEQNGKVKHFQLFIQIKENF